MSADEVRRGKNRPVPPDGRSYRSQMPQTMGINQAHDGRKIQKLQAHRQHDPGYNQTGPGRPRLFQDSIPANAESAPEDILDDSDGDVGRHIVAIIPSPQGQIGDVGQVQGETERGPQSKQRAFRRRRPAVVVEPEDAHQGVIQSVQHAGSGGKVVCFFRDGKVSGVEDGAEDPGRDAEVAKDQIISSQRIARWDHGPDLLETVLVRPKVQQGEQHGEGLLNAEDPLKGPFAVVLYDRVR